jgi:hypothetical protein
MKQIKWFSLIVLLLLSTGLWAETQGTFRGDLVEAPQGKQSAEKIYVQGHDGNVRSVVVTHARIGYDEANASANHGGPTIIALVPGTEVRVTAEMDAQSGEWTASRVEVIPGHAAAFEDDYGEDGSEPDPVTTSSTPVSDRRVI